MNPDDPRPLPAGTLELLRAEKGAVFAPDDARARVLGRLEGVLHAPAGPRGGRGPGGHGAGGSSGARLPGSARSLFARPWSLGLAFAIGAVTGAAGWSALRPPPARPAPEIVYVDRVVPASPSETALAPTPPPPSPPAPTKSLPAAVVEPPIAPPGPDGQLAAERGLLDVARTALGRGDGADALAATSAHEKRFPSGALAEEREAMAVQALILLQRYDEARARGLRFHKRFQGSVLAPSIDAALGAIP